MEDKFKEIQRIFKSQKIGDLSGIDVNAVVDSIVTKLVNFEKKQLRINLIKIALLSVILLQFTLLFKERMIESITILSGMTLIILGSISFMIVYMKFQFKVKKLKIDSDSISFINEAINLLENHLVFFKKYFWIFTLLLLLALNMMYVDIFGTESFETRILYHSIASIFLIGSFILGFQIRSWRHKKEYMPLIAELKEIKTDLEAGVEDD